MIACRLISSIGTTGRSLTASPANGFQLVLSRFRLAASLPFSHFLLLLGHIMVRSLGCMQPVRMFAPPCG
jgi:hypothetical protein